MKAKVVTYKHGGYAIQTLGNHWYSRWKFHTKTDGSMEYRWETVIVLKTVQEAEELMLDILADDAKRKARQDKLNAFKQEDIASCSTKDMVQKYPQYFT